MPQDTQRELQARIEEFARDITDILQRAVTESLKTSLGRSGGGRGNGAARDGGRAAKKKSAGGRRRSGGGGKFAPELVLKEVSKEGGRRITQIAEALGAESDDIRATLKQLVADKKIKASGKARGTKYTAV